MHPVEIHAHPLRQSSLRSSRRLHHHRICPQTHSDVDASLSGGHFTPRLSGDDALRHHEAPDLTKRISFSHDHRKERNGQSRKYRHNKTHHKVTLCYSSKPIQSKTSQKCYNNKTALYTVLHIKTILFYINSFTYYNLNNFILLLYSIIFILCLYYFI